MIGHKTWLGLIILIHQKDYNNPYIFIEYIKLFWSKGLVCFEKTQLVYSAGTTGDRLWHHLKAYWFGFHYKGIKKGGNCEPQGRMYLVCLADRQGMVWQHSSKQLLLKSNNAQSNNRAFYEMLNRGI